MAISFFSFLIVKTIQETRRMFDGDILIVYSTAGCTLDFHHNSFPENPPITIDLQNRDNAYYFTEQSMDNGQVANFNSPSIKNYDAWDIGDYACRSTYVIGTDVLSLGINITDVTVSPCFLIHSRYDPIRNNKIHFESNKITGNTVEKLPLDFTAYSDIGKRKEYVTGQSEYEFGLTAGFTALLNFYTINPGTQFLFTVDKVNSDSECYFERAYYFNVNGQENPRSPELKYEKICKHIPEPTKKISKIPWSAIGGAIGGVVAVIAIGLVIYFLCCTGHSWKQVANEMKQTEDKSPSSSSSTPSYVKRHNEELDKHYINRKQMGLVD